MLSDFQAKQIDDNIFMQRCLQLAANGKATCAPNPMVGAVIVHQGRIIGEGWHRKAGEAHAEPVAIRSVKQAELLKESTLYVNLEPCSHYGKTPPCADLIIEKHIPKVVIGCMDPFPAVGGRGIAKLRAAGIKVKVGVLEDACLRLNRRFFGFHQKKRPYIVLKWAQTADGFIDRLRKSTDEPALKISDEFNAARVHCLRSESDAIMIGTNTALLDCPSLNIRLWPNANETSPLRVVLDRRGVIPESSPLFDDTSDTLVFSEKERRLSGRTQVQQLSFDGNSLSKILEELYHRNVQGLLVEGGACLHQSFIQADLWDEIRIELSDRVLHKGVLAATLPDNIGSFSQKVLECYSGRNKVCRYIRKS